MNAVSNVAGRLRYYRNSTPAALVSGIEPGEVRHGLSDGQWDLVDLLRLAARRTGPKARLLLAVWTASGDHGKALRGLITSRRLADITLLVDRSFVTRKPEVCADLRRVYGDDSLLVWSCHAKFAVFLGGEVDLLLMFSANLNRNRRIENYTVWADSAMCDHYRGMVADLGQAQAPGEGFADRLLARRITPALLGPEPASKFDEDEFRGLDTDLDRFADI